MKQMVRLGIVIYQTAKSWKNGNYSVIIKRTVAEEAQKLVGQTGLTDDQIKQKLNQKLCAKWLQVNQ